MSLRTRNRIRRAIGVTAAIALTGCTAVAIAGAGTSTNHYLGSMSGAALNRPVVGMAATRTGHGYWLAAADGGVFTFGDARFYGSTGKRHLAAPIVGIAPTRTGHGYWLAAADGGVFTFGDARFHGSAAHRKLTAPIVGIAATGHGYWLAASNGAVLAFGNARWYGSDHRRRLGAPVVGIAATRSGRGYWLTTAKGAVLTHGDARFLGSALGHALSAPIAGITVTHSGTGYWLVGTDGSTYAFGHARPFHTQFHLGTTSIVPNTNGVVAIAASPRGGYWVASRRGTVGVSTNHLTKTTLIALQLVFRMNAERAARHLPPFQWDPLLAERANSWANTLLTTNAFHHQSLGAIADAAHGRFSEVGENIYSGTGGAADAGTAHVALMNSVDHRENILLPQGQLVGIGAACNGDELMIVEDFAIRMGSSLPSANAPVPPADPIVAADPHGAHC